VLEILLTYNEFFNENIHHPAAMSHVVGEIL
jgi:hypothetical protein